MQYAQYGDRFRFQPEGLFAGEPGSLAFCTIERGGEASQLKSKESAWLQAGDVLTVNTGGGGGYGSPTRRAGDQLDDDVEQGKVSPEAAAAVYGAEIEASK